MNKFNANTKKEQLKQLSEKTLDMIVIGGGITGAGIVLDAAARGLDIALFEMQDFAAGTSSRSTKLIHGGLRYLKQLEINVVAEVGKERAIVYENGPHVTTPEWMLLPLYKGGTFGKLSTRLGLTLYDYLAQVKRSERKKMLSVQEVLQKEPLISTKGLVGGGYYVEYKTDDARLTIEVIKKAVELGAFAFNYMKVIKLLYREGNAIGVQVVNTFTEEVYNVYARKIVNAAGPWVDDIRELDKSKQGKTLMLTKGVHLIFDESRFPLKQAVYFDTPDGRMCFAIPREGKTYFGTTDTTYEGSKVNPTVTENDKKYLLQAANSIFTTLELTEAHIEASYAGLRPLIQQEGKGPSEVSRRDEIFVSPSGLISIAGGKLTGYRKMAEDVVSKTIELLGEAVADKLNVINTKYITISGGDVGGAEGYKDYIRTITESSIGTGLTPAQTQNLASKYGSNIERILMYADYAKQYSETLAIDIEEVLKLLYALDEEMVETLEDYFMRRTGYLLFNVRKATDLVKPVSQIMAIYFKWTEASRLEQIEELARKNNLTMD